MKCKKRVPNWFSSFMPVYRFWFMFSLKHLAIEKNNKPSNIHTPMQTLRFSQFNILLINSIFELKLPVCVYVQVSLPLKGICC